MEHTQKLEELAITGSRGGAANGGDRDLNFLNGKIAAERGRIASGFGRRRRRYVRALQ